MPSNFFQQVLFGNGKRLSAVDHRVWQLEQRAEEAAQKLKDDAARTQRHAEAMAALNTTPGTGRFWNRAKREKQNAYQDVEASKRMVGALVGTLIFGLALTFVTYVVGGRQCSAFVSALSSVTDVLFGWDRCSSVPQESGALAAAGLAGFFASFFGWMELHCARAKTFSEDRLKGGKVVARAWDDPPPRGTKSWAERELEAKNYTRGFALLALTFGVAAQGIRSGASPQLVTAFFFTGFLLLPLAVAMAEPFFYGVKTSRMPGFIGSIARNRTKAILALASFAGLIYLAYR